MTRRTDRAQEESERRAMKHFEWTMKRCKTAGMLASMLLAAAPMVSPQASAAQAAPAAGATIHGHVQNAAGFPLTKGEVRLTTDRSPDVKSHKYLYVFRWMQPATIAGRGLLQQIIWRSSSKATPAWILSTA